MKTELVVEPADIIPGKKIFMTEYNTRNFRLHLAAGHISRLMLAMLENQSNNSTSTLVPENVRDMWSQFELIKTEVQFARDHNDAPNPSYEHAYKVILPKGTEVMGMHNIKQKRVAMELELLARIFLSRDSAALQSNVSDRDFAAIDRQIAICEAAMEIWLGRGSDNSDTGNNVPPFQHLGMLQPNVDLSYRQIHEPTKEVPDMKLPTVDNRDA